MITDNEEFAKALSSYTHPGRDNPYIDYSLTDIEHAFEAGGETTEKILTAKIWRLTLENQELQNIIVQHDKEIEDFAEFVDNHWFDIDIKGWGKEEILKLFREHKQNER
jgi:hypothetical protein